jgi:methionyl-tRNA formyltransferase
MSEAFDAGPIYAKAKLSLKGSAEAIYKRCMLTAARMIKTIIRTQPVPKPQSGKVVAFKRRQPSQSLLPKNLSVEQVYDFIRMLDAEGYPHAYVEWGNLRMELQSSKLSGGKVTAQVTITQNKTL